MAAKSKVLGKRSQPTQNKSAKKRKLSSTATSKSDANVKSKGKGKERAYDKGFIAIPVVASDESDVEEDDVEFYREHVGPGSFLKSLDEKGISRSKNEQERLHKLNKPVRKVAPVDDDLPSINSHSEDEDDWSSDLPEDGMIPSDIDSDLEGSTASSSSSPAVRQDRKRKNAGFDSEMPYEKLPRKHHAHDNGDDNGIARLPIKFQNGVVQLSKEKVVPQMAMEAEDDSDTDEEENKSATVLPVVEDVSTGARYGRPAVIDIITAPSRKGRIESAKVQIAGICQDIIAEPENHLGLLRRLINFCRSQLSTPSHPEPADNDVIIRKIAVLSAQAVFKDIIPGYRIRALTDKEKAEKVSQMVQRTRDFEQGLVNVYQSYLQILETEVKAKNELSDVALRCICRLLTDATHFNFRTNLISAVVSQLSRKSWDESSELCRQSLATIFRSDTTGQPSLEVVRLLNRMIKERTFNVHPNVMFCLLDLRLKDELGGIRASQTKAGKDEPENTMSKGKAAAKRANGKKVDQPHLSKNAKKKKKEIDAIGEEMREANAEVDHEERQNTHTETLKLLFVLYFRILKNDKPTPLLPAALQGISRFAHLVNVDFFTDLLQVLRKLMAGNASSDETADADDIEQDSDAREIHHRLHCIVTAFELLSGQGEALNIDLTDFVNQLYAMIMPVSMMSDIESPVAGTASSRNIKTQGRDNTPADMLFRALSLSFSNRGPATGKSPPWRFAAFAKRLATASLYFPPATAKRALPFILSLMAREPKLEVLLSTEDKITDGIYRPDVDDPQVSNPFATNLWELQLLSSRHADAEIRRLSTELLSYVHDSSR